MPRPIGELTETGIIAEMRAEVRRLWRAVGSNQAPVGEYNEYTLASSSDSAHTLTFIPALSLIPIALLNGLAGRYGADYTVDFTTGIVTWSATKVAGDILSVFYQTTGDLVALSGPADSGSITDNFNRTNATALGTTSDGLGTWIAPGGSSYGQIGITSNQAALKSLSAGGTPIGMSYIDVGDADGTLQVTFPVGFGDEALAFRIQDFANYWQAGFNNATTGRLYKVVGGNFTAVGVTWPMTVGDKVIVVLLGSSITVKNTAGTVVASTTDSTFSTVTKHGLIGYNLSDRWEDWSWTP